MSWSGTLIGFFLTIYATFVNNLVFKWKVYIVGIHSKKKALITLEK